MGAFVYAVDESPCKSFFIRFDYKYRRCHANSSVNIRSKSYYGSQNSNKGRASIAEANKENRYRDGKITRIC